MLQASNVDPADRLGRRRSVWIGAAIFVVAALLRLAPCRPPVSGATRRATTRSGWTSRAAQPPAAGAQHHERKRQLPGPFTLADRPPAAGHAGARGEHRVLRAVGRGDRLDVLVGPAPAVRRRGRDVRGDADGVVALGALLADRVWNPHAFLVVERLALLAVLRLRENPESRWAIVVPCRLPGAAPPAPVGAGRLAGAGAAGGGDRPPLEPALSDDRDRPGPAAGPPLAIHEARTGLDNTRAFMTETSRGKEAAGPGRTSLSS